jgi:Protein of unknown function (DUF2933)
MLRLIPQQGGEIMKPENRQRSHGLWMTAGCAAMLLGVLALSTTGTGIASFGYLLFLLCPIMHLLMHKRMHGTRDSRNEKALSKLPPVADVKDQG